MGYNNNNQFNGMIQISRLRTQADAVYFLPLLTEVRYICHSVCFLSLLLSLCTSLSYSFIFLSVLVNFLEVDLERTTIKWEKQENAYQKYGQFITASHLKR